MIIEDGIEYSDEDWFAIQERRRRIHSIYLFQLVRMNMRISFRELTKELMGCDCIGCEHTIYGLISASLGPHARFRGESFPDFYHVKEMLIESNDN